MIANMRLAPGTPDHFMWHSRSNPFAPRDIQTSGVSQPPVLAEAVQRISEKMEASDRRPFIEHAIGRLAAYHDWIYRERNPDGSGLFAAVKPWETGMENTPSWMEHMKSLDWGMSGEVLMRLGRAANIIRRDTHHAPAHQRANGNEGALFFLSFMKLRHAKYDYERLEKTYPLHFQDVALNSIFVRNNQILEELSDEYKVPLSDHLKDNFALTRTSLEDLYDETDRLYYPRDAISGKLIKIPTIASTMPLYAGTSPGDRMASLVEQLDDPAKFNQSYGVPTVPYDSPYLRKQSYWAGPTWVNTNWLLIDGLRRAGYDGQARRLGRSTLEMVARGGMREYFDAETAEGLGAQNFSWTAALVLDLIHQGY